MCLIPTTIGGLLSAIGIAGMDRLLRKNVLAMSGRAVEAAGDVDTLLLDKTGTITLGNRMATEFIPVAGRAPGGRWRTRRSSRAWPTRRPEGRSIVILVKEQLRPARPRRARSIGAHFIPFTAQTRMSGCDLDGRVDPQGRGRRRRAARRGARWPRPGGRRRRGHGIARYRRHAAGRRRTATACLGVIHLKDVVKGGIKERFARFRAMGIRTVMITGDNPRTAAAIAREAGVDDFLAEATPEAKMASSGRSRRRASWWR